MSQKGTCKETLTISFNYAMQIHQISTFTFFFVIPRLPLCQGQPSLGAVQIAFLRKQTVSSFPTSLYSFSIYPVVSHELVCHLSLMSSFSVCIVFCPSVESIRATLDLNSDMQCPLALCRDGYMNSI